MHPEIAQFPSEYFYDSQLYNGPNLLSACSASWHGNKGFGAYKFFDVSFGREQKTSRNSVQNIDEAIVCAKLVKLLCSTDAGTNFKNKIGIISFYRDQVRSIKKELFKYVDRDLAETIDVMTVDGFQGQEKDVILLSCVRAGGGLGFITDTRRMNVALTRAKKTMIVLGHAETLCKSKEWNALIENSKRRKLYEKLNETRLNSQLA
jgi:senataxin